MGSFGLGLNGIKLSPNNQSRIWRPPQWNQAVTVSLNVPPSSGSGQYSQSGAPAVTPSGLFVFDAVIRAEHSQRIRKTEHPVQTGANISDHAYVLPAQLVMDIGMSDAMDAFQPGMWTGNQPKSVSAYQTLLQIQLARVPITITTKLRTYSWMVIEDLPPVEEARTYAGLRMRVTFGQIFVASTASTTAPVSARPQDGQPNPLGTKTPQPVSDTQDSQYNVGNVGFGSGSSGDDVIRTGASASDPGTGVIGAGEYSSVNTSNLSQLSPKD